MSLGNWVLMVSFAGILFLHFFWLLRGMDEVPMCGRADCRHPVDDHDDDGLGDCYFCECPGSLPEE